MKITQAEVAYVARLARLELDEVSTARYAEQIGRVLEYMEMLGQVNTDGVPPTAHATAVRDAFREDAVGPHLDHDAAMANAPEKEDGSFIVPRVVG